MSSKSGGAKRSHKDAGKRVVADNRRARYDYEIVEVVEAGLQLFGSEVKSLREGKASLGESYASQENSELYLLNANIPEYPQSGRFNHEPKRRRKLLLHRKEIDRLAAAVQRDGMTLVPLKLFFNDRGIAKLELALAKGKKMHDKREAEKERSWNREKSRLLRERG
jgi:SsrA-binding protein